MNRTLGEIIGFVAIVAVTWLFLGFVSDHRITNGPTDEICAASGPTRYCD